MKLTIKYATILKIDDHLYYVYDENDLVAKFYNKEDAKEFADYLNEMYNSRRAAYNVAKEKCRKHMQTFSRNNIK